MGVPFTGTWIFHIDKNILIKYGVLKVPKEGKLCAAYGNYRYCVDYKFIHRDGQLYVQVTDLSERTVTVKYPARRIIIAASPYIVDFIIVAGSDWSMYIVGWEPSHFKEYRRWIWDKYSSLFPKLDAIPNVGSLWKGTFNPERVIALKPDVVIAAVYQLQRAGELLRRVEAAGVPVLIVDFHSEKLETHVKSILLLGLILGKEERAVELARYYMSKIVPILERVCEVKTRPKVFIEGGFRTWWTYGNYMWGAIVTRVGGINIAEGKITRWGEIDPEYVIASNPDVWIVTCSYWATRPKSVWCGYYANKTLVIKKLITWIKLHRGYERIKAVQEGKVYTIHHGISRHIYDFVAFEFIAKALHPDLFKDVDPFRDFIEFHEKFLPVKYSGVWFLCLNRTIT